MIYLLEWITMLISTIPLWALKCWLLASFLRHKLCNQVNFSTYPGLSSYSVSLATENWDPVLLHRFIQKQWTTHQWRLAQMLPLLEWPPAHYTFIYGLWTPSFSSVHWASSMCEAFGISREKQSKAGKHKTFVLMDFSFTWLIVSSDCFY